MGLREDKKREMRAAIIATALERFRVDGYEQTRVQDIAARLRISEATFFNYFPTKPSVLEAVADGHIAHAMDLMAADDQSRPVPVRLERLVAALAHSLEPDHEFATLLASHTDFYSAASHDRLAPAQAWLVALFGEGQGRGEIRDDVSADQLASVFLSATMATAYAWAMEAAADEPLEARLVATASIVLGGCEVRALVT